MSVVIALTHTDEKNSFFFTPDAILEIATMSHVI